ncbi:MAG: hypothetical protein ACRDJW_08455 [Thermomicrobiales bacterium]
MDEYQFDTLTKALATGKSRRAILKGLLGGFGSLAVFHRAEAARNQPPGTPCTRATECASFHCVDGVCCDSSCTGQCEACSAAGICTTVSGAPRGNRPACPGNGACAATCDGQNPNGCTFPGSDVVCGEPACVDGRQTTSACGGNGTCHPTTTSCGLFVCNPEGTVCRTTCSTNEDCVGQAHCADGVCQGDKGLGEPCRTADDCQHGHCVDDVCCISTCGECEACNVPGNEGFCGPAPDGVACKDGTCCGEVCLPTNADPINCGGCGVRCRVNETCRDGTCVCGEEGLDCTPGFTCCPEGDSDRCTCTTTAFTDPTTCERPGLDQCPTGTTPCVGTTGFSCMVCCPAGTTCDTETGSCFQ